MLITENQTHILRHTLGLDENGLGRMYRNHYCIPVVDSKDKRDIDDLVTKGLMEVGRPLNGGKDVYYHVTPAGRLLARGTPPKVSKARRRYLAFLALDSDLSFHEFLTSPGLKDYRRNC